MNDLKFTNKVSLKSLYTFILKSDNFFNPSLSTRVSLDDYAQKLYKKATVFAYVNGEGSLVGAVVVYQNDPDKIYAYIPFLSVAKEYRGRGIFKDLFKKVESNLYEKGFQYLGLETWLGGDALAYYLKNGFYIKDVIKDRPNNGISIKLNKSLQFKEDNFPFSPTPLQAFPTLGQALGINLFIKRDDLFNLTGGGSKARKLQYILRKAYNQGCNAVVTAGGSQSNHVRATAIMSSELGMRMKAIIHDDKTERVGNLKLTQMVGADISFVAMKDVKSSMDKATIEYVEKGYRPFYIWGGGHSVEGAFAYYRAIYELKDQLGDKVPDYIVLASGTGTTQAGIEVAVKEIYPDCKVLGVSVARDNERGTNSILSSIQELERTLKISTGKIESIFFDDSKMGSGYEDVFPELLEVISNMAKDHGLILDPIYSGKAFYGLKKYIEEGIIPLGSNVVFWHTGSLINTLTSSNIVN
ncbi:hypothetical protein GCM10027284_02130 [Cyclobacterium sediminis]